MASELRVNTLKDAAGSNEVAMTYVAGGSAKAWVNFNGSGTPAARDSLNHSSLTDISTGMYANNYSSSFGNVNYSIGACGSSQAAVSSAGFVPNVENDGSGVDDAYHSTSSTGISLSNQATTRGDAVMGMFQVFGDLA